MKNIAVMYRGQHSSHRLLNATLSQYDANYMGCQSRITIFPYCIDKVNQLRLDRFLIRNEISLVYVHAEEKDMIEKLKELNVDFLTFTRSDFCERRSYGYTYVVDYDYTFIKELITSEKQGYGKIKKYKFSMDKLVESDIFTCDEFKYSHYFDSEKQALSAYINELEKSRDNAEKRLVDYIASEKKRIKQLSVKINSYLSNYEKME